MDAVFKKTILLITIKSLTGRKRYTQIVSKIGIFTRFRYKKSKSRKNSLDRDSI